jgi:S1-C subfamily serine protease
MPIGARRDGIRLGKEPGVSGSYLDLLLLTGALGFAISGYRQGFVVGALSFVGFFGGALIGIQLAPVVAGRFVASTSKVGVALAVAFGCALIGQVIAVAIGSRLRAAVLRGQGLRAVDGLGGSVVSVVALLLVAWMVATPLALSPSTWLAAQVRQSIVVHSVDKVVPDPVRSLYERFGDVVERGDFPQVLGPLTPTEVREVPSPDPALVNDPVVRRVQASVVKVVGQAPSCDRRLEGSGFVYAPGLVMTNAHVVAGVDTVRVESLGRKYGARVVVYDPRRDLAVLRVGSLQAEALPFNAAAQPQAGAIVVGYPQDGPYKPTAARIREVRSIYGPDIYQSSQLTRQVLTLKAEVRSGNSGGPLLAVDGSVYGVIFAAAVDDPDTGFALAMDEVQPVADAGRTAVAEVDTQGCD